MANARTVESLKVKRAQVEAAIASFEEKLAQARADLAHLTGAIAIFEASGDRAAMTAYANFSHIWKPRELPAVCKAILKKHGPMTTRDIAVRAIAAKEMDTSDPALVTAITNKLVYVVRMLQGQGRVRRVGRKDCVFVWALSE